VIRRCCLYCKRLDSTIFNFRQTWLLRWFDSDLTATNQAYAATNNKPVLADIY